MKVPCETELLLAEKRIERLRGILREVEEQVPKALAEARNIALEEAAAVCENLQSGPQCVTAIRRLMQNTARTE